MVFNKYDNRQAEMMLPVMETYSGKQVNLLEPSSSSIDIEDIAHHLSRINRFTGATHGVMGSNVATHSFWVSNYLFHQTRCPLLAMHGLLHDAHEAYTGDFSAPLKAIPALRSCLKPITQKIQSCIMDALQIPAIDVCQQQQVKDADLLSLAIEARKFMRSGGAEWHTNKLEIDHLLGEYVLMSPDTAKQYFFNAFLFLNEKLKRH